ncbi:MAG: malectin domain-containing carbohydrate-binding protein [Tepidisphaerales bacterium]
MFLAASPGVPVISGLTLIDADTNQPVSGFQLQNGAVIDLAATGYHLSIRAELAGGGAQSVRFGYDGAPSQRIDNDAPYTIAGETRHGTDFISWTPALGTHTLIVTPYTQRNGLGAPGKFYAAVFTVIDSSAVPADIRINAGGKAYTTAGGVVYSRDQGFLGGQTGSSTRPVSGTTDQPLYQTWREGKLFVFLKTVPDGTYKLSLDFAEPAVSRIGKRVLSVLAEGQLFLDRYDIAADVGVRTAVTKTGTVTVTDGRVEVWFFGMVGEAIVSAIELVPTRTPVTPAPARVNAGGAVYTDSLSRTFDGDSGFVGGTAIQSPYDVLNTDDDPLFYSYRAGQQFTFSRPIANGHYALWLEFAEPNLAHAGDRVFDVAAEGQQILTNYDITATAGAQQATAKQFNVEVTDGSIDLAFQGKTGDAIVSAIVLVPTDIPAAVMPYSGLKGSQDYLYVKSASYLRQIGMDVMLYMNDNKGKLPRDLATVFDYLFRGINYTTYANPRAAGDLPRGEISFVEQLAWVSEQHGFLYFGAGLNRRSPADAVLACENPELVPGDLNVLFMDGHVAKLDRAAAEALIGVSSAGPAVPPVMPPGPLPDAKVVQSMLHLLNIGQAMSLYWNDHRWYPPDFGTLYSTTNLTLETFINPRGSTPLPSGNLTAEQKVAWVNASTDYIYVGAGKGANTARSDDVLAYENPSGMATGIGILFADGHVEFREMRWALETLARAKAL